MTANGTWPEPRFSHTTALSADGRLLILFGGNNFDAVNELFTYDIERSEWSKLKAEGEKPSKRYGHQAVVLADGRMIVFGGYNGTFLSDVHELAFDEPSQSNPRWRPVPTSGAGPCARDGHSAVLAPDGTTLIVFGGFDGKRQLNDLFALDTRTFHWTPLAPERASDGAADDEAADAADAVRGSPAPAGAAAAAADAAEGGHPQPRYLHSAVVCGDDMLVYGGYLAGGEFADDLWKLSLGSAPDADTEAAADDERTADVEAAADESSAGATSSARGSGVRMRWSRLTSSGDAPGGLFGHAATVDGAGRLWVSGGFGAGSFSSALHVLEPRTGRWTRVEPRGARPSPRHKHTLVASPADQLLLFGGNDFGPTRGPEAHTMHTLSYLPALSYLHALSNSHALSYSRAFDALMDPCIVCGPGAASTVSMHPPLLRAPARRPWLVAVAHCWQRCACSSPSSSNSSHWWLSSSPQFYASYN